MVLVLNPSALKYLAVNKDFSQALTAAVIAVAEEQE